jgi:hypothetical protein
LGSVQIQRPCQVLEKGESLELIFKLEDFGEPSVPSFRECGHGAAIRWIGLVQKPEMGLEHTAGRARSGDELETPPFPGCLVGEAGEVSQLLLWKNLYAIADGARTIEVQPRWRLLECAQLPEDLLLRQPEGLNLSAVVC